MTKDSVQRGHFLLVYGSQTGQSKAIAEELAETAASKGLSPDLMCFSQYEKKFCFEREKYAVIITSTTGEGEPPETVLKFWRRIRRKTLANDYLSHLNYALLGLGDSNYNNFCNCGKLLDQRLEELGAKHFYPSAWADDAVGLEIEAEPFMEGVLIALTRLLLPSSSTCEATSIMNKNLASDSVQISENMSVSRQFIMDSSAASPNTGLEESNSSEDKVGALSEIRSISIRNNLSPDAAADPSLPTDNSSSSCTDAKLENTGAMNRTDFNNETLTDIALCTAVDNSLLIVNEKTKETDWFQSARYLENSDSVTHAAPAGTLGEVTGQSSVGEKVESLVTSLPPLSDGTLTVPVCPQRYLSVVFTPNEIYQNTCKTMIQNGHPFAGARSTISLVPVIHATQLTSQDAMKTTLSVQLDISSCDWSYEPGDTIGVVCPNSDSDVQSLIDIIGLSEVAHSICAVELLPLTTKRNACVPEHLTPMSSIFHLLQTCCELRDVPRKSFIRALVDHTSDDCERRRLQELCSKQGNDHYTRFIRQPGICLLDILAAFPSCRPPIDLLLEHLPRLQPRPYSASSSPLDTPGRLQFMFNIIKFSAGDGRCQNRVGVCTGWLNEITLPFRQPVDSLADKLSNCSISERNVEIPVFLRTNRFFRLPDDAQVPIIMIGPGTGVAPFLGFIKHRDVLIAKDGERSKFGEMWLFYGCRHASKDHLCRSDIADWQARGILTKACVSFSRDSSLPETPRYVQDNLRLYGNHLSELICVHNAVIYVCGDAVGMAPEVLKTIRDILVTHRGCEPSVADALLTEMRLSKRFLEDIWI